MKCYPNTTLELMVCSLRANGAAAHLQGQAKDANPVHMSVSIDSHSMHYQITIVCKLCFPLQSCIVPEMEKRSHTWQIQGTKRNAAMVHSRPISYPWRDSDSPSPPLPEPLPFLLEVPRARCHSHTTQSASPRM